MNVQAKRHSLSRSRKSPGRHEASWATPEQAHELTSPSSGPGAWTPPSSGSRDGLDVPNMLMSPPPEETLRVSRAKSTPETRNSVVSANRPDTVALSPSIAAQSSKRKRPQAPSIGNSVSFSSVDEASTGPVASTSRVMVETTPNPKARKQSKRHVSFAVAPTTPTKSPGKSRASTSPMKRSLLVSPHADNPQADYILPLLLTSKDSIHRRGSTTPMPHYEPPPERFTPPREVTYTPVPSVSKSSKRKSTPKAKSAGKVRRLTLQIKKEPPDIDLNAPLPPPSPTDDPLLLTGPSYSRRRSKARISHVTHSRETPPIASSSPVHPSADDTKLVDMNFNSLDFDTDDDNDHIGPIPPIFNFQFHEGDEEPWSDDEPNHNDFEHSGEYTGKFKILTVPTKADPPSSCTRGRMDAWGHPISPFPYSARRSPIPESPVREAELDISDSHNEDDLFAESRRAVNGYINGTSYLLPSRSETSDGQLDGLRASPTPERKSEIPPPPLELPTQEDEMDAQPPEDMSADTVLEYDAPLAGDEEMLDFSSGSPVFHAPENCPEELAEVTDYASTILGEIVDDGAGSNEAVPITDKGEEEHRAVLENSQPTQPYFDSSFSTTRTGGSQHADASHANYPVGRDMVLGQEESAQDVSLECGHSSVLQESIPDSTGMLSFTSGETERISQRSLELEEYQQDTQTEAHQELLHSPDQDIDDGHQDREEEEEDTASVVRELSHEPDFRSDDDDDDDDDKEEEEEEEEDGQGFNFNYLPSSPNNPFRPDLPLSPPALSTQVVPPHYSEEHESARQASYVNISSDDDDEDLDGVDPSVVKITSDDPMAAARAAAILRLHKYDCLELASSKKHRDSHSLLQSALKNARRKSAAQSGVTKGHSSIKRRSMLGGVLGDKVIIPGSPATTLPRLLMEAEASLIMEESIHSPFKAATPPNPFKTPARDTVSNRTSFPSVKSIATKFQGPREWAKADWKLLDSCYTDERLAIGERSGLDPGDLAPADSVTLEDVVDRFIEVLGGEIIFDKLGSSWTRDNLLKRARALCRKQGSGIIAPPSRSPSGSYAEPWTPGPQLEYSTLMSPNTPVYPSSAGLRQNTPSARPTSSIPLEPLSDVGYNELLASAIEVSNGDRTSDTTGISLVDNITTTTTDVHVTPLLPRPATHSLAGKVKGFIFSYLPKASKAAPPPPAPKPLGPRLPVPPPEIFQKPRPMITTPAPKQPPKPIHPKDLVQLHPAPPPKASMIPRHAKDSQPGRFVELQHVPPRPSSSASNPITIPRDRRDSGASVKDLVKNFETMEKLQAAERDSLKRLELRRKKSVQEWNKARLGAAKPMWRP